MFSTRVERPQGRFFPQCFVLPGATEAVAKQCGDRRTLFCWRFGLFLIHWNPRQLLGANSVRSARISLPAVKTPPLSPFGALDGWPWQRTHDWRSPAAGDRERGPLCRAREPSREKGTGDVSLGCNGASWLQGPPGTSHRPDVTGVRVVLASLMGPRARAAAGAAGAPVAAGSARPFPPRGDKVCPSNPAAASERGQPERRWWGRPPRLGQRVLWGSVWVPHGACVPAGAVPPPERPARGLCSRSCHRRPGA